MAPHGRLNHSRKNTGSVAIAERNSTAEHFLGKLPKRIEGEVAAEHDGAERNDRRPLALTDAVGFVFHDSSVGHFTASMHGASWFSPIHFAPASFGCRPSGFSASVQACAGRRQYIAPMAAATCPLIVS